jgi:NAD+ kinase
VGILLHPRRDVRAAHAAVEAWGRERGIDTHALADPARAAECDLVLALGGDGTMLGALRVAAPHGVPVLGVNLGRLGYLTEIDGEHLEAALDAVAAGSYATEQRLVLRVSWDGEERVAYNDIVLSRTPGHGQAALGLSVNGELLVRYASSGVIVATPMGSTAYNFAAGGPIVSPQTRAIIVTPDAPHGLFNRAVVLGDEETLGVEVLPSGGVVALEVDGRLVTQVERGWNMEVSPAAAPALVVRLGPTGFAERARRKLGITDPAAIADYEMARRVP